MKQNTLDLLHQHSEYSNLRLKDCNIRVKTLVDFLIKNNYKACALTDHEVLSGLAEFYDLIEQHNNDNPDSFIKPILGNEIYLLPTEEETMELKNRNEKIDFYHCILLAKDKIGFTMLKELSSRAWSRSFFYKGLERVPTYFSDIREVVNKYGKGHLIMSTACLGSMTAKKFLENDLDYVYDFWEWCLRYFDKDFYLELQPSLNEEQIKYNKFLVEESSKWGIDYIITCDTHYLEKKDRATHKAFLQSDREEKDREVDNFYDSTYIHSIEELYEKMNYLSREEIKKGIHNTNSIKDKVEYYSIWHDQVIPVSPLPPKEEWYYNDKVEKQAKTYPFIKEMLEGESQYNEYFIRLVLKGLVNKKKEEEYDLYLDRVNLECDHILGISEVRQQDISCYFLTMVTNLNLIWDENTCGSLVMPGRGSAGGYECCELLGITAVDSLKQPLEMPYYRFIHKSKIEMPDIDVDISNFKRSEAYNAFKNYYQNLGGDCVRVATFSTLSTKSAIQTACRGLGINDDIATYISGLVPSERGKVWSFNDCYNGNIEKGRLAIIEFKNTIDIYKELGLKETIEGLCDLVVGRSEHACGQLITNTPIYKYNALMKAPNGGRISQFNLGYSEKLGLIKYDILCTSACGNIQLTLDMLVKDGYIEDKGSLRATYESVLLPEKLDRDNPIVWEKLRNGELLNAFQYVGQTGENAIREIGIDSFETAVAGNNVMRLMAQDGGETPLHKYARFKKDITLWYKEMDEHGLNEKEKQQMIELLGNSFGVMSSQEQMMEATIKIVGFDIPQSNIARKAVAKKKEKLLKKAHEMIYEIGFKNGCRKEMLDYLWDVQIAMQRGYGFSQIHGVEYTYILLMELELITKYPAIYWDTALLLNEGGIIQDGEKEKNAKVGKLSKIISILQKHGVDIKGSNINKLNKDFKPNAKDNIINISLKQISGINNDTADLIEQNAPYSSMKDFYERMVVTKREVILSTGKKQMKSLVSNGAFLNLVKAGVFDEVEDKTREDLVLEAVKMLNPIKQSFTIKDIDYLLDIGAIPEDYVECVKYYNYRMCVLECDNYKATEIKNGKWYILRDGDVVYEERLVNFFLDNFSSLLTEDKDYRYNSNGEIEVLLGTSRKGSFEKVVKDKIEPLMNYLKTEDCIKYYKEIKTQELIRNNAKGTRDTWYFDSCGFYEKDKHELMSVNNSDYLIDNFNDMPETPIVERFNINKNGKFPQYKLYRIMGTILDYDNNKSSITILDKMGEVVNIMFNKGQFNFYKKQISYNDDNGDKIVLEKPWISRGNLVMINGFRREGNYIAKSYANSPLGKHTLKLIEEVYPDGTLKIKSERINLDELD